MNTQMLSSVEEAIRSQQFPENKKLFAGAGLIVTGDSNRNHHEGDVLVVSPLASQISWVVFQMKEVFAGEIDHMNKYGFYPALGEAANTAIEAGKSDTEILMAVVERAKRFWSE